MAQVIIFKNDAGGVSTIYPMPDAVEVFGIDFIAKKDVPSGKPYKIMDQSELPDRTDREVTWDVDEADLSDGVGAQFGAGTDDAVIGFDLANRVVALRNENTRELKAYNLNTGEFMEVTV